MGLFDGITNPWANGGLNGSSPKWAQPGQEHGWGGSDSSLNPPTKEKQREQENLQLAIVAASAVAPDMVAEEQRNGGGTQQVEFDPDSVAPSPQSSAVNPSELYPSQVPNGESEFNSPYGSAQSAVGTVLTPFKYPNSTEILRRAAIAGERHLNEALHRFSGQPDLTIHGAYMREYHASITLLLGLVEEIGKNVGLRHELRQLASFSISRLSRPSLDRIARLVRENLPMENVSKALESVIHLARPWEVYDSTYDEPNLNRLNMETRCNKLTFEDEEMEHWFWNIYFPAMSPEDQKTIIDLSNSCSFKFHVIFKNPDGEQGGTLYDFQKDRVEIMIATEYQEFKNANGKIDYSQSVSTLGDEFQHAKQVNEGKIGYVESKVITIGTTEDQKIESMKIAYDLEDEIESQEGALRATENYILSVLLVNEVERAAFRNTSVGRKDGYRKLLNSNENKSINLTLDFLVNVKNPFNHPESRNWTKEKWTQRRYAEVYFRFGSHKPGLRHSAADIISKYHFKVGSNVPETMDRRVTGIVYVNGPCNRILEHN
jgi:hypothetical protein